MKNESKNRQTDPRFNNIELKLEDIIDAAELQAIADEFYAVTNVGIGVIDMNGNIFVANGWQDICTKFHRVNPETCKNCIESDILLSKVNISATPVFKAYKCKNNLWDISTPLIIDGKQYGNIFLGQFFYDDETPDYEFFRLQAKKYGFDEKAYLDALDRVPRWSKEKVESAISFYSRLVGYISRLSFNNLKISETLDEKRNAEEALQKSEKKYRRLAENLSDVIWITDLDFNALYTSRSCERLFGYKLEEYIKLPFEKKFTADSVKLIKQALTEEINKENDPAVPKDRSRQMEAEHTKADGTTIWIGINVSFTRDEKGKINGLQGVSRDISERKKAQCALQKSEEQANALIQAIPDLIFRLDKDGVYLSYKAASDELYYLAENIIGKRMREITPPAFASFVEEKIKLALDTRTIQDFEYEMDIPGKGIQFYEARMSSSGNNEVIAVIRNVTTRKSTDLLIVKSEKEFRSLFDNAPIGIYRTTPEGKILMANPFLLKMLEYNSFEELQLLNFQKEGYEPDYQRKKFMQILEKEGEVSGLESEWKTHSGKTVLMNESARIIRDTNGDVLYYEGMVEDITDQKLHEENLKHERNILRTLIDNLPDAIYFLDSEGKKVIANKADLKNIGISNEADVLGKNDLELFAGEIGERGHADNLWVLQTGNPIINREENFFDKSGVQTWLETSKFPLYDLHGKISGLVGIGHDITKSRIAEMALRESEERYRVFINSTQDMAFVKDENLRYIMVNQSFTRFFERNESEIIGKTDAEIMKPEFARNCELSDQKALTSDNLSLSEETVDNVVFEVHKFKVTLNTGKTGVGGYIRNITERKTAEKLVLEQSEKLKELNATKDKFFSIIAHDLRNPFNSIIGFSNILKDEARSLDITEIIHFASVINNAAGNTMILLDNLLDWALMQQNRIDFVPRLLVVSELARETLNSVANNAEQKNIQLMSEIPARLLIPADENMIKTVIRNLVSNAIKFTKPGGKVIISAVELSGEVHISVTDNGVGISPENLSNLFNITSGLSTRGTSNEKGTGIGLILCKEFVEKHGGRIWVNSTMGVGSSFTFSLPA